MEVNSRKAEPVQQFRGPHPSSSCTCIAWKLPAHKLSNLLTAKLVSPCYELSLLSCIQRTWSWNSAASLSHIRVRRQPVLASASPVASRGAASHRLFLVTERHHHAGVVAIKLSILSVIPDGDHSR